MAPDNPATVMSKLKIRRPVFHNEADFQHELAWQLHLDGYEVRLERRFDSNTYVDLWLPKHRTVFELKYVTNTFEDSIDGEKFSLKDQSARDTRCYDFLKDIQRIENITRSEYNIEQGWAIILTNDKGYWEDTKFRGTNFDQFRIHEGVSMTGVRDWAAKTAKGAKGGRDDPIRLSGVYDMNWRKYADHETRKGLFKYLMVRVSPTQKP